MALFKINAPYFIVGFYNQELNLDLPVCHYGISDRRLPR